MLLRDLDEVSSLSWVDVGCVIVFDEEGSKEIGAAERGKGTQRALGRQKGE